VAWNMAEKHEFAQLLRAPDTAAVLLATFVLTIFIGLAEGIAVGSLIGGAIYLIRKRQGKPSSIASTSDEELI